MSKQATKCNFARPINFLIIIISLCSGLSACFPGIKQPSLYEQVVIEDKLKETLRVINRELAREPHADLFKVRAALQLVQELKPHDARVKDAWGCLALQENNFLVAKQYFQEALAIDPSYDPAYAHLATIAEHDGKMLTAQKLYQLALSYNPLNYQARNNYALLLYRHSNSYPELKQLAYRQLLMARQAKDGRSAIIESNIKILAND